MPTGIKDYSWGCQWTMDRRSTLGSYPSFRVASTRAPHWRSCEGPHCSWPWNKCHFITQPCTRALLRIVIKIKYSRCSISTGKTWYIVNDYLRYQCYTSNKLTIIFLTVFMSDQIVSPHFELGVEGGQLFSNQLLSHDKSTERSNYQKSNDTKNSRLNIFPAKMAARQSWPVL